MNANHTSTKLNAEQVTRIRQDHASGKATMAMLAREYGVSWTSIKKIVVHHMWKHVE